MHSKDSSSCWLARWGTAAVLLHAQQGQQQCLLMHDKVSSNAGLCMTKTAALLAYAQHGQQQCLFMHKDSSSCWLVRGGTWVRWRWTWARCSSTSCFRASARLRCSISLERASSRAPSATSLSSFIMRTWTTTQVPLPLPQLVCTRDMH